MNSSKIIFETKALNKYFGPTHANKNIDFTLKRGEIHGLAGENGSGKSTLLSQIAGLNIPDSGEMLLGGKAYNPRSPIDANNNKIAMVVQELGMVSNLPASVNVFLGRTSRFGRFGMVSMKKLYKEVNQIVEQWGIPKFPSHWMSDRFNVENRKMIELARALSVEPDILLLDEITQSLSHNNRDILYGIIKKLKEMGKTILLITHDIDELIEITDTITVLRDGEIVTCEESCQTSADVIRNKMVGRIMQGEYYRADLEATRSEEIVLEVRSVSVKDEISDVSFDLHAGEILGFCGLSDSGIHTVGKALFGLADNKDGSIKLKESNIEITSAETALRNNISYVPKDRDHEGLMMKTTIQNNVCLPNYTNLEGRAGYLKQSRLKDKAQEVVDLFDVKCTGINQLMNSLSGGNKQKINLGRWLVKDLKVLVLDCPTRGVDVGVKAFIYSLIKEAKARDVATVLISDELTEVLGMSDRLMIMKNGRISGEVERGKEFTEEHVIGMMI